MENLFDRWVLSGGIMMVPLILCSLLTVGFMLQWVIRLSRRRLVPPALLAQARQAGNAASRRPFILSLRDSPSPLGRGVWYALKDFAGRDRSPDLAEVDALVEEATAQTVDDLYDRLGMLTSIYTIAPLLGLMGTILGMMKTFTDFGVRQEKSIEVLSVGIQEALVTTLWGLGIAIVAFLAAQWCQSRIRRYERQDLPVALRQIVVWLYAPAPESDRAADRAARDRSKDVVSNRVSPTESRA
jgi:biopolymer transport protein ExbB